MDPEGRHSDTGWGYSLFTLSEITLEVGADDKVTPTKASFLPSNTINLPTPHARIALANMHLQSFQIIGNRSNSHCILGSLTMLLLPFLCMLAQIPRKARMITKSFLNVRHNGGLIPI